LKKAVHADDTLFSLVRDQFLRYDINVNSTILCHGLVQGTSFLHNLTISFVPAKNVDGRFTACSGGWDWAPYAREQDAQGTQMFTLGIVKPVSIISVRHFYVSYVVPKLYYLGGHPTTPMQQPMADFRLDVAVHINFVALGGSRSLPDLVLKTDFGNQTAKIPLVTHTHKSTVVTMSLTIPKEKIELWWPNGMGSHRLYDVYIGTTAANSTTWIHKRVGFRVSALVTTNDTAVVNESATAKLVQGSGQHGFYFRINGAVVLARGANFIPADQLEGRLSDQAHRIVVQSAARANMNMIRIWGGGMLPPQAFYDACDEEGILLYHDMMFVDEEGHRPVQTATVEQELRHVVRSLASHPSIIVWSGCNECDVVMGTSSEIYATFVMKTVAEEDDSRSIWPSSPSKHGWKSGVRRLDSRPIGQRYSLTTWDPKSFPSAIETHGPYMRSFSRSYRGVNGNDAHFPYMNTPPDLETVDVGVSFPNQFSSEFGSSVMSSFESMAGTLSETHWSIHGGSAPDNCTKDHGSYNHCLGTNVMAERNYPCDTHIFAYFGIEEEALNEIGKYAFQKQLYMCLIAQTLWMKGEIESRRSKNMFGILIWQLNENFPTGGWGCIEYSKRTQDGSQILGGRWKPLMHLLESSLFRDQIVACGKTGNCYVRNDGMNTVNATISFEAWPMRMTDGLESVNVYLYNSTLEAGHIRWFQLPAEYISSDNQVTLITLKTDIISPVTSESVFLPTMPKNIAGLHNSVSVKILSIEGTANKGSALVSLESDRLALYVVLTTRAGGRFSENCFALRPLQKKVTRTTFHKFRHFELLTFFHA
jgi:beta-mannosidase